MSFYLMLFQSGLFATGWTILNRYVAVHGSIKGARRLTKINSRLYSVASLILFFLIVLPKSQQLAQTLYHASKFYEYIDIANVIAIGGDIDLHFGFHHLTTPYLTYFRVIQHNEGWRVFAALNALHHTIMYAYFGGASIMRVILPFTGTLQLIVGLLVESWLIQAKHQRGLQPVWPNTLCFSLLLAYLILWTQELRVKFGKAAGNTQVKRE